MKMLDVLSKVSGIPENEISGIYETVKINQQKLSGCQQHDFSIDICPDKNINKTWQCTRCGGQVNSSAKMWYDLGMHQCYRKILNEHTGQNAEFLLANLVQGDRGELDS